MAPRCRTLWFAPSPQDPESYERAAVLFCEFFQDRTAAAVPTLRFPIQKTERQVKSGGES